MLSVFLSYARVDALAVEQLAMDLRALGCAPWFDSELAGGADWWSKILAKIRETNVFVFAISNASLESPACMTELAYAREVHRRIIPVLVGDGVQVAALPRDVAVLHRVDYRRQDKNAALALARSLLQLDPEMLLPEPLPEEPKVPLSYLGELRDEIDAKSLTFDEQSALVLRIKDLVRSGKSSEVLEIAVRFRRRRDLFAIVAEDLDEAIARARREQPAAAPKNAPAPSPPPSEPLVTIPRDKLTSKSYATLRTEFSDEQLITALAIAHDGARYRCPDGASFFFVADAVGHALDAASPAARAKGKAKR